jgi:hypothetical protein
MADTSRQRVVRADGRTISVVQRCAYLAEYSFVFYDWESQPWTATARVDPGASADHDPPSALLSHADTDLLALAQASHTHGTHLALDEVRFLDLVRPMAERTTAHP